MNGLSDYLDTLSEADPALAELLDTYKEIVQVFDSANAAVNLPAKVQPQDNNTAKVTISFQQSPLSSMGGHLLNMEKPVEFHQLVLNFLESLVPKGFIIYKC